jgi:hypothetical protein
MTDPTPTPEDADRAAGCIDSNMFFVGIGRGWRDVRNDLAAEFARVRSEQREACAKLVETKRCWHGVVDCRCWRDRAAEIRDRGAS